jgi:hypothetical protein
VSGIVRILSKAILRQRPHQELKAGNDLLSGDYLHIAFPRPSNVTGDQCCNPDISGRPQQDKPLAGLIS